MEEALECVSRDLPDVALVDIGLPGLSGVGGIRQLANLYPRLHLLVLSVYSDDDRIFDAICAGGCGYPNPPNQRFVFDLHPLDIIQLLYSP